MARVPDITAAVLRKPIATALAHIALHRALPTAEGGGAFPASQFIRTGRGLDPGCASSPSSRSAGWRARPTNGRTM